MPAAVLAACGGPASSFTSLPTPGSTRTSESGLAGNAVKYSFTTMDDPLVYSNFNRLLGINNLQHIVGYYGSGAPSDPSEGYVIYPPYAPNGYHSIVYPKALDTEATALNNKKMIVGFYKEKGQRTLGFLYTNGIWSSYEDPNAVGPGTSTKLFSINDSGVAVGCYQAGSNGGCFELKVAKGGFDGLNLPGRNGVATGINGNGDLVGYTTKSDSVVGFLRRDGTYTEFSYPGAVSTQFLGVTVHDYIVGSYVDQHGATHGFLLTEPLRPNETAWQSIDDPNGVGTTVVTSVNIHEDLVGYYVDGSGTTHGFLATPSSRK